MSKSTLDFIYDSTLFVDLYSILQIDIDVKQDEIKTAYITLAKKNHPDQGGSSDKFQEITRAYEVLYNKETRKEYDLYYLKKNMDEFGGDDILRLKDDYKNWVSSSSKQISKEELDKLYLDTFNEYRDKYKEIKINQSELIDRMKDIEVERKNMEIENTDDSLNNFIKEHGMSKCVDLDTNPNPNPNPNSNPDTNPNINVNDVFEYLKYKNSNVFGNNNIMLKEWGTLDTIPGYSSGYTSFVDDNEYFGSNLYSSISDMNDLMSKESMNNLNIDDFVNWKNTKRSDTKLSESELDNYLKKRQEEELLLFDEVETNLSNGTKKKEVEKFLKTKHLSEDVERYYDDLDNYKKNVNTNDNNDINLDTQIPSDTNNDTSNNLDDMLKYMEKIKVKDFTDTNTNTKIKQSAKSIDSDFVDLKTNRELPKINNVRKREFTFPKI